jgi:hypothetical protein
MQGVTQTGYKYIYNNTGVLLKTVIEHPYYRPAYKKTVMKNNLFHIRYNGGESFFQYWKTDEPGWDYTTFVNGPLLSHNIYWKASTDPTKVWFFKSNSEDMRYDIGDFAAMRNSTGQDSGSMITDPALLNSTVFDNAEVFTLQYDTFSDRSYLSVINDGYDEAFKNAFITLYNYFVISPESSAVNKGELLPALWPDIKPWDGKPDIGMSELDKSAIALAGHWAFEDVNTPGADSSLYNRTALFKSNISYSSSNPLAGNGSVVGDGTSNSYIVVNNSENIISGSKNFTIAAWIKISSTDLTTHRGIVSKGAGYNNGEFAFYIAKDSKKLRFYTTQSGSGKIANGSLTVADGQVHHVAVVRRWNQLLFYVDGQLDPVNGTYSDFFSGHSYTNSKPLTVGARGLGSYSFKGTLDDVRLYNSGLLWSEIQILNNK